MKRADGRLVKCAMAFAASCPFGSFVSLSAARLWASGQAQQGSSLLPGHVRVPWLSDYNSCTISVSDSCSFTDVLITRAQREPHMMGSAGDQEKSCTASSFTDFLSSSPMSGAS